MPPNLSTIQSLTKLKWPMQGVLSVDNTATAFSAFPSTTSDDVASGLVIESASRVCVYAVAEANAVDQTGNIRIHTARRDAGGGIISLTALANLQVTFGDTIAATKSLLTTSKRPGYLMTIVEIASGFNDYNLINPVAIEGASLKEKFAMFEFNAMGHMIVIDAKVSGTITALNVLTSTH